MKAIVALFFFFIAIASISAQHITVENGVYLKADSGTILYLEEMNLSNEGTIHLLHNASLVQTNLMPSNSGLGNYIVERLGAGYEREYNYWSTPVFGLTKGDVFTSSNSRNSYFYGNTTQSWSAANDIDPLNPTEALVATGTNPNTGTTTVRTFSSTMGFNSGMLTYPAYFNDDGGSNSDTDNDWNLVGNPYPSGLSVTDFLSINSGIIDDAVYLWNSTGSDWVPLDADYATMNSVGVTGAGGGDMPTSNTISSCQGFFVRAIASGNIMFDNAMRIGTNNTFMRTQSKTDWHRVWLTARHQTGYSNEILIGLIPDAKEGNDQYDAIKLSGNQHLSFYMPFGDNTSGSADDKLVIQGFPHLESERIIPLGLTIKTGGIYTFDISHLDNFPEEEGRIILYDAFHHANTNLREQSYAVKLVEGEYTDRFSLGIIPNAVTDLEDDLEDFQNGVILYGTNQQVHIQFTDVVYAQAQIGVFDVTGKLIHQQFNETDTHLSFDVPTTGVYIVKVGNTLGMMANKVLVE